MSPDFLKSIIKTEQDAAELIEEAAAKAASINEEARKAYLKRVEEANREATDILKKAADEASEESAEIIKKAAESVSVEKTDKALFEKCAQNLAERIVQSIGNS